MEAGTTPTAAATRDCSSSVLLAALIVLLIVVCYYGYRSWRARHLGPPANCKDYPSGPLKNMCETGVDICNQMSGRDVRACRSAVGACMPAVEAGYNWMHANPQGFTDSDDAYGFFNQVAPHIPSCGSATKKISPTGVANALDAAGISLSLPPAMAPIYKDPKTRGNVQLLAGLVPGAVDWSLEFGENLPVRKETFDDVPDGMSEITPGNAFPTSTPGGFASTCAPLCPRASCYADMGCGPQGYCQAYFADDPTYGGQCVPF